MRLNLQPALKELGYSTIAQQVAMIKIFAYSQDHSRIISDENATETLLKKQFADVESSVEWLNNLSKDSLINAAGVLLHDLKNNAEHDTHREELVKLFTQAGVITSKLPESKNFDYAIILGGASPIVESQVGYLKKLWEKNQVRFNDVVLLGGRRIINQEFEKSAESNEISMMVKHYKDKVVNNDNADSELRDVLIHIVDTPARMHKDGNRELPTAEDTLHEWLIRRQMVDGQQSLGKILVVSNNPFIGRSNAVVRDALGRYSDSIETVGNGISPELAKGYIGVILHYIGEHITHDNSHIISQLRKKYPDLVREKVVAKLLEQELSGESFIKEVSKPSDSSSQNAGGADNNEDDGQRYRSLKEDKIEEDIIVAAAATAKTLVAADSKKTEGKSDKNINKGKSGKKSSKAKSSNKNIKQIEFSGLTKDQNISGTSPFRVVVEQISRIYSNVVLSSSRTDNTALNGIEPVKKISKRKPILELPILLQLKMIVSKFTNAISSDINAPVVEKRDLDPEVVNTTSKYHKTLQIKRKIKAFIRGNNQAGSLDEMMSGGSSVKNADKLLSQGDLSSVGEKELRNKLFKSDDSLIKLNESMQIKDVDSRYTPAHERLAMNELPQNIPAEDARAVIMSKLDNILLDEVPGYVSMKFEGRAAQHSIDNVSTTSMGTALGLNENGKYSEYEVNSHTAGVSIKNNYNINSSKSIVPDNTQGTHADNNLPSPVMKR